MGGRTSRTKGAAGERELCSRIHALTGVRLVRRLDQCRGGGHDLEPEPGDTSAAATWLRRFAPEVKRHRAAAPASVATWWAQAVRQADAAGLVPLLAYRADRAPWHVVVPLHALAPGTAPADDAVPHMATLDLEGFAAVARGGRR